MATSTYGALEWVILSLVLVPVTAIVSIVTNAVLIAAIRTRGTWDTTDTIFFALTVSDCLHGVVSLFGALTRMLIFFDRTIGEVLFPIMMTTFYYFLFNLPALISKTLTAMLSVERTIAVFYPAKFKLVWSKRRVIIMVCCLVFLVTTSGIPRLFQLRGAVNHNDTSSSAFIVKLTELASGNRNALFTYNLVCQNLFGTVPIILVFVLNLATLVGLRKHNNKITSEGAKHTVDKNKSTREQTNGATKSENEITEPVKSNQTKSLTISELPDNISNQPYNMAEGCHATNDHQSSMAGSSCPSGQQPVNRNQKASEAGHTGIQVYIVPTSSLSHSDGVSSGPSLSTNASGNDHVSKGVSQNKKTIKNTSNIGKRPTAASTSMSTAQKRITVTLVTIATVFVILNLPGKIIGPIFLQGNASSRGIFQIYDFNTGIGKYMELLNSIVNSIIYVVRSQKYMSVVKGMFTCCK